MLFLFILSSEKIIKTIFHFKADSLSDTLGSAAFATAALGRMQNVGKKKGGGGGGSNKYADPKSMTKATANPKNVKQGGNASRPSLQTASTRGSESRSGAVSSTSTSAQTRSRGERTGELLEKRGALGSVLGSYIGTSLKLGTALTFGALYAGATGDLKTVIPVGTAMGELAGRGPEWVSKRNRRKRLAKAYNDYADHLAKQNPNLSAEEINERTRERAVNLMQNNVAGQLDDYDKQLQDAMKDINETYKNSGMGEEARNEQINKDFGDIEAGKVSEIRAPYRFRGNIKKVANNVRRWGFGSSSASAEENTFSAGSGASANNAPNPNQNNEVTTPQGRNPKPAPRGERTRKRRKAKNSNAAQRRNNGYGNEIPPQNNRNNRGNNNQV